MCGEAKLADERAMNVNIHLIVSYRLYKLSTRRGKIFLDGDAHLIYFWFQISLPEKTPKNSPFTKYHFDSRLSIREENDMQNTTEYTKNYACHGIEIKVISASHIVISTLLKKCYLTMSFFRMLFTLFTYYDVLRVNGTLRIWTHCCLTKHTHILYGLDNAVRWFFFCTCHSMFL